jgi:hypothetical protein
MNESCTVSNPPVDLFTPLDPENPEPPSWIGGTSESAERVGDSFLAAADILAEAWRSERGRDQELSIALPIIQNYRHAIELILKAQCLHVRRLIRLGRRMGIGGDTEPDNLEAQLGTHAIADLVKILDALMVGINPGETSGEFPEDVAQTLKYLHDLDAAGMAFRYATQPVPGTKRKVWEPVRPDATPIHLDSAITRLHDAAKLLTWGLGGFLDAYEDFLQDRLLEYSENMRSYNL